jgi:RHS repeat-associated protein
MKKIYSLISTGFWFVAGFSQNVTVPPPNISSTENYVYVREYLEETSTSNNTIPQIQSVTYFDGLGREKQKINIKASSSGKDLVTRMEYDALGRKVMDFLPMPQQNSANGEIYSPNTTPYTEAVGNPLYGGIAPFFSKNEIEFSPLNRPLSSTAPGDWSINNKKVTTEYKFNNAGEVKKYTTVTSWSNGATSSALNVSGTYAANQLYKTITTDEDTNVSIEYKDKLGQIVLIRKIISSTENADTYYIYDEYQDLAYVLSPLASIKSTLTATDLDELCYQYRYDDKSRLAEKKLPGKGWEYFVYDNQDRLVMTQDANMGAYKLWLFTKYDQFSRVAYAGIYTSSEIYGSVGRNSEQTNVNGKGSNNVTKSSGTTVGFTDSGLGVYYDNDAAKNYPNTVTKLLSVNYYDTYPADLLVANIPTTLQGQAVLSQNSQTSNISTKIRPTASFVKNIEDDKWTKNYIWYDSRGRVIGMHSVNNLGGYTKTETLLDFTGVPQKAFTYHKRKNANTELPVQEEFIYDPQNRLMKHYHEVVGKTPKELLTENHYNEIGQLDQKKVGGTGGNPFQTVDYRYNIRGWLTGINSGDIVRTADPDNEYSTLNNGKLFGYSIRYNNPENTGWILPKYNGNIAEIDWIYKDSELKRYGYQYDGLNRLLNGIYQNPDQVQPMTFINSESIEYDLNGNISHLYRNAKHFKTYTAIQIDNLSYNYSGGNGNSNRLQNITDASLNSSGYEGGGATITYDLNGNMTAMPDKGISAIAYNFLNLPSQMNQNANTLKYFYSAGGTKLKKVFILVNSAGTKTINTEYLDGFQYSTPNTEPIRKALEEPDDATVSASKAGEEEAFSAMEERLIVAGPGNPPEAEPLMNLSFFPTAEGYYDFENFRYIYQYKDHLGNVRLSYLKEGNIVKIMDQNDYYPFGMSFLKNNQVSVYDPMAIPYNYKYNGKELQETGMYDYGARMYMPDIARWFTVDPLAEKSRRWNPYTYAFNNPIRFIDPDGREGESAGGDSGGGSGGGEAGEGSSSSGDGIERDANGNEVVSILGGIKISAGTAAISVTHYGDSSESNDTKKSNNSKNNNNNSKEGLDKGENSDSKPSDNKDEEPEQQLKPPGKVELKGIPQNLLKDIAVITEEKGVTLVNKNGEYEADGIYFKPEVNNPDRSWFKVSSGWKATVTYDTDTNKFVIKTTQTSWHGSIPGAQHRFMKSTEEKHWSPNPFKK